MDIKTIKALEIIGDLIENYERSCAAVMEKAEREQYQKSQVYQIANGIEILSAATGKEYHWSRYDGKDGQLISQIILVCDGESFPVSRNYAKHT